MGRLFGVLALLVGCVHGGCLMGEPLVTSASLPICKEWENREACCSEESLLELAPNWAGLNYHFDRCVSCKENWEHVLCTAACSPRQDLLVHNSSLIDPKLTLWGEERRHTPLLFSMRLSQKLCDKLWYSCEADDTDAFSADGRSQTIHYTFNDGDTLARLKASNNMIKTGLSPTGISARGAALENSFSSFGNFSSSLVNVGSGVVDAGKSFVGALKRANDTVAAAGRRLFCEMMSAQGSPGLGLKLGLRTTDPVVRRSARPVMPVCPEMPATLDGGANCTGNVCENGHYALPATFTKARLASALAAAMQVGAACRWVQLPGVQLHYNQRVSSAARGNLPGFTPYPARLDTADRCQELCDAHADCSAFSWRGSGVGHMHYHKCFLMSNPDNKRMRSNDFLSAARVCDTTELDMFDVRCMGRASSGAGVACRNSVMGFSPLAANKTHMWTDSAFSPLAVSAVASAGASCDTALFDCSPCYRTLPPVELRLSPTRSFDLSLTVPTAECKGIEEIPSLTECGPLKYSHPCGQTLAPFCDEATGKCSNGQAQDSTTYDYGSTDASVKQRPVACLTSEDVAKTDKKWNAFEFCYLQQNNQIYLSRSAGHTMEYVILLIMGAIVANAVSQSSIECFPACMSYVIMGAVLGGIALNSGLTSPDDLSFDTQFFTFFLLPPIIFAEGFSLNIGKFANNLGAISAYAIIGTLISVTFLANVLFAASSAIGSSWDFPQLSFNEALAFSAMICATDPVATCDTFNEHKVDHTVEILVVGESLVNDAAAIVLYKTFKEWVLYEDGQNTVDTVTAISDFMRFVAISVMLGLFVAMICSMVYKFCSFKGNPGLEITVFLLMAYSTFLMAEFVHVSGILSSLVGGIVMAYYAQRNLSDYTGGRNHTAVEGMLHMLAALSNMLIFLMVGMALVVCFESFSLLFTLLVLVFTLVGRALAVFPITWLLNKVRAVPIPQSAAIMMWWSGLRGAVALALAVDMPSRHRYMMVSTTCVLICFTVLVYGGGTVRMLRRLKIRTGVPEEDDDDDDVGIKMKAWLVWNDKVLVPLLTTKPPPLLDGDAKAELAMDELSLTKKALKDKTKELANYARKKDRQIEKILKKVDSDADRPSLLRRIVNARCCLILFNLLLFFVALAGVVGGAIVLRSEFGTGDVEKSCHYMIAGSAFVCLCAVLGLIGACRKSRLWLAPYILLLIVTLALEIVALAVAYDVEGALTYAKGKDFDPAKYRQKEQDTMRHVRVMVNSTFAVAECKTTRSGSAVLFACSNPWVQSFTIDHCTTASDAAEFMSCESAYAGELLGNTDIFCACRSGVVALINKHSVTMGGIGIAIAILELILLLFSCCVFVSGKAPAKEVDEDFNDAVYEDKKVIELTKALADAKEAASKKLNKEHEKDAAKFAKAEAKVEAKKKKAEKGNKKTRRVVSEEEVKLQKGAGTKTVV